MWIVKYLFSIPNAEDAVNAGPGADTTLEVVQLGRPAHGGGDRGRRVPLTPAQDAATQIGADIEMSNVRAERDHALEEVSKLEQLQKEADKETDDERKSYEARLQNASLERAKLREELNVALQHTSIVDEMKMRLENGDAERDALRHERDRALRRATHVEELQRRLASLEAERTTLLRERDAAKQRVEYHHSVEQELRRTKNELNSLYEECKQRRQEFNRLREDARAQINNLRLQLDESVQRNQHLEASFTAPLARVSAASQSGGSSAASSHTLGRHESPQPSQSTAGTVQHAGRQRQIRDEPYTLEDVDVSFAYNTHLCHPDALDPDARESLRRDIIQNTNSVDKRKKFTMAAQGAGGTGTSCCPSRVKGGVCKVPEEWVGEACPNCITVRRWCMQKTGQSKPVAVPLPAEHRRNARPGSTAYYVRP